MINIIPVQSKEWELSLEFIVFGQLNEELVDILSCSTHGIANEKIKGSRLPRLFLSGLKTLAIHVWNRKEITHNETIEYNVWYKVDVKLERVCF